MNEWTTGVCLGGEGTSEGVEQQVRRGGDVEVGFCLQVDETR